VLFVFGINHHQTPLATRESLALSEYVTEISNILTASAMIDEAMVLSTCNRSEIYVLPNESFDHQLPLIEYFIRSTWCETLEFKHSSSDNPHFFALWGVDSLEHLARVAVGLEAMMLGEPQILGQVKQALQLAYELNSAGPGFENIMNPLFELVKKVRTETNVGCSPTSFASATFRLASHIFTSMESAAVLLVGAGEMIELVCRYFYHHHARNLSVANRNVKNIAPLCSNFGVYAYDLEQVPALLEQSDIIIACTASLQPIITRPMVQHALKKRRHQPMFFADLAVPRDIEPSIQQLDDAFLYTVDDIYKVVNQGQDYRSQAAENATKIIKSGIDQIVAAQRVRRLSPTIHAYRRSAETVRIEALAEARRKLIKGDEPHDVLEQMSKTLTNKLIHQPTRGLRTIASQGDEQELTLAKQLLGLVTHEIEAKNP